MKTEIEPRDTDKPAAIIGLPQTSKKRERLASQALAIKRILVPTDFSEPSVYACQHALALADRFGAEISLVHVIEPLMYADTIIQPFSVYELPAAIPDSLRADLEKLAKEVPGKVRHIVRLGRVWQEIVNLAAEDKSDLIVIATHGYTGLRHVLLGSVAEKVVRHAPCMVLVVREKETREAVSSDHESVVGSARPSRDLW